VSSLSEFAAFFVPTLGQMVQNLISTVDGLPASAFGNANNKKALRNKLLEVQTRIAAGGRCDVCQALSKLRNDVLPKVDGRTPPPDSVTDAAVQVTLMNQVLDLISRLQSDVTAQGGCGGC
jgi:hypothetical protein